MASRSESSAISSTSNISSTPNPKSTSSTLVSPSTAVPSLRTITTNNPTSSNFQLYSFSHFSNPSHQSTFKQEASHILYQEQLELSVPDLINELQSISSHSTSIASSLHTILQLSSCNSYMLSNDALNEMQNCLHIEEGCLHQISYLVDLITSLQSKFTYIAGLVEQLPSYEEELDTILQLLPQLEKRVDQVVQGLSSGKYIVIPAEEQNLNDNKEVSPPHEESVTINQHDDRSLHNLVDVPPPTSETNDQELTDENNPDEIIVHDDSFS